MTNYLVSPPGLLSEQIYSGAGTGPLLDAAQSWAGLADELSSAAGGFSSVIAELARSAWTGPASAAMVAAAGPFTGWLGEAASQASRVATQANAAAAVFEAARAKVAHPLAVALVNSNLLGLHAPAIATAEAEYEQMWAQDVAAMVAYHGESAAVAAQLKPWQQPPRSRADGSAAAAAAGRVAAAGPGGPTNNVQSVGARLTAEIKGFESTVAAEVNTGISNLALDPTAFDISISTRGEPRTITKEMLEANDGGTPAVQIYREFSNIQYVTFNAIKVDVEAATRL